jgi:hypothetical protein
MDAHYTELLPSGARGSILREGEGGRAWLRGFEAAKPPPQKRHPIGQLMEGIKDVNTRTHDRVLRLFGMAVLAMTSAGMLFAQQQNQQQQQTPPPQQQPPPAQQKDNSSADKDAQADKDSKDQAAVAFLPRGKKLYLKDGTFQLVRSYERQGESVRYYSVERSSWEEIPAAMVDWDATAKAEADEARQQKEFAEKVKTRENNQNAVEVLDVDASLQTGSGAILPYDQGMYAIAGKTITVLKENKTEIKVDKGRVAEKIVSGAPALIPSRHFMEIKGKHAAIRLPAGELEFYYRIAPGEDEPDIAMIRAKDKGDVRVVEKISTNIIGETDEGRFEVKLLRWEVAKGVYRFTVSEAIEPGEYVLSLVIPDQLNPFVWDFGVDRAPGSTAKPK